MTGREVGPAGRAGPLEDLASLPAEITRGQLEKVIHRAAELQFARDGTPDGLEPDEVVRIAEEAGLEGRYVRQALAEMRADALLPAVPEERTLATRLWGPTTVVVARVVPGAPAEIQAGLARHLEERESLRCVRNRPGSLVLEPASDLMSQLRRGLDFSGRGYELARARSLRVMIQPLEEGRSLVSVTADIGNQRTGHVLGWFLPLTGFGIPTALVSILAVGEPALVVIPAVAGGVAAVGTYGVSRTLARRRTRMELALQGLLDRLETGSRLSPERPTLRDRITEFLDEGPTDRRRS
ncbi:MAG: hypothetical protein RRA92_04525 [Gemmatimonadota bacterium]|nr:hypothetical protein [Gemmatimonadota bacterium]